MSKDIDGAGPAEAIVRLVSWKPPTRWQKKTFRLHSPWRVGVYAMPEGLFISWQFVSFSLDAPNGSAKDAISAVAILYSGGDFAFDASKA